MDYVSALLFVVAENERRKVLFAVLCRASYLHHSAEASMSVLHVRDYSVRR